MCDSGHLVVEQAAGERRVTHDRHAIARIDALVNLPRSAKEGVDRCGWTRVPADGKLAAFPLEPEHEFLRGRRGRVALCVAEDEVEADVALKDALSFFSHDEKKD